jgi:hypothetical protein
MFKNLLLFIGVMILSGNILAQTATAPSGSGTSSGDPYLIATLDNLYWVTQNSSSWGSYFKQTADIDASSTSGWDSNSGFTAIGNSSTKFTGTYDGEGHTIDGLYINRAATSNIAMFGSTNNATIKNLGLTNVNITGNTNVGALVGYFDYGTVEDCYATGSVTGIGGTVGGLIAIQRRNTSNINRCYSGCDVSGSGDALGGFVGVAYGNINESYSSGSVTGTGSGSYVRVGGFSGNKYNTGIINNCYSRASVNVTSSYSDVGGFTGLLESGGINYSYSTGSVSGTSTNIGGFAGRYLAGSKVGNYWDTETSGQGSSAAATGKLTSEMTTQGTFTGYNFTSIWAINGSTNNGYPYLQNNTPSPITLSWDGSESAAWNTAGNWDGNAVPTSADHVVIANAGTAPVIASGVGADCNNLTVNSGATLTVASGGSLIPAGAITNNGTITIQHSMTDGKWHLVSSPVSGATANVFNGDYLQYFVESSGAYFDISDETTDLNPCQGYAWRNYAKGDFTFTGTPYHGNQSIAGGKPLSFFIRLEHIR